MNEEMMIPGTTRNAIEKGITYLSKTGELQASEFKAYYKDELKDAKSDLRAIQKDMESQWNAYEKAFAGMGESKIKQWAAERRDLVVQSYGDFNTTIDNLVGILDTYSEVAQMIESLEDGGVDRAYVEHRKGELLSQSNHFNDLFYKLDLFISRIDHHILNEYNDAVSNKEELDEEGQVKLLSEYNRLLEANIQLNKALIDRLMYITPIVEHVREDVMKMKVRHADEDVARRKQLLEEKRGRKHLEDVTDYEDLEGQYRHKYNEAGEHIATEEGGDGSNRNGIITILVLTAIVIAIFCIYVFLGKH